MADIKLFNIIGKVKELRSGPVTLEKELQTIIENNMMIFFGVTFLASEYQTTDGGRMDSLGIDIETLKNNGYNLDIKNPFVKEEEKTYSTAELLLLLHE